MTDKIAYFDREYNPTCCPRGTHANPDGQCVNIVGGPMTKPFDSFFHEAPCRQDLVNETNQTPLSKVGVSAFKNSCSSC